MVVLFNGRASQRQVSEIIVFQVYHKGNNLLGARVVVGGRIFILRHPFEKCIKEKK